MHVAPADSTVIAPPPAARRPGESSGHLESTVDANDGDDELLRESFEARRYTPNIGADQGHGALVWAGAFTPGVLSGNVLYRYEHN